MFNSKLQPMFNGSVLMNDKAIHDQAVMNALQSFAEDNFEFKSIDSSSYNISDRDWFFLVNIHSQIAARLLTRRVHKTFTFIIKLSTMFNMFLTVSNRTSSAVEELKVDAIKKQAIVTFKNGDQYAYGNVSSRAIINVLFNQDVSLGFWVNRNLLQSERTELLNGDQFDYSLFATA